MISKLKYCFVLLLGVYTLMSSGGVFAQKTVPIDALAFGQIPILHEGRIKPMDSFARALRKLISGTERDAMPWLMDILFDPGSARDAQSIKIMHPDILTLLNLPKRKSKLYSFSEVSEGLSSRQDMISGILDAQEKDWTPAHKALVRVYEKKLVLNDLMHALNAFFALSTAVPDNVPAFLDDYKGRNISYYDLHPVRNALQQHIKTISVEKGSDFSTYTPDEQALAHIGYMLAMLDNTGRVYTLFRVIPEGEKLLTPWEAIDQKHGHAGYWADLVSAYHSQDETQWRDAVISLSALPLTEHIRERAVKVEYYYNNYNPFIGSFILSLCALMILFTSTLTANKTAFSFIAFCALSFGLVLELSGLGMRIYILERPPVSTLYETVLFVICIVSIYSLLNFLRHKSVFWLWFWATLVAFLHIVSFSHNQDGDSLMMLGAVLNTNFWLATHVLCIMVGYAFCAITSALAHYALVLRVRGSKIKLSSPLFKNIHTTALCALLFCTVGTVLGGIWADQSWGRFWGWDPKENGALLIVLWLIWLLHGRISGKMRVDGVLYGLSYLSVILGLSWFGVNLLSVGLHAYGFTDSMAWSLGVFVAIETLFVFMCFVLLKVKGDTLSA